MSDAHERAAIAGARRYRLRCERIGETFQIDVALPSPNARKEGPLPVVYVLDGNSTFGIAAQAARLLQDGDGARAALIVGVGYCLDGTLRPRDAYGALRTRDLTPSVDEGHLQRVAEARGGRGPSVDVRPAGGAEDFLAFLVEKLRPFIAERYEVDPTGQALVGSSLGGLFSLYALFKRPEAFGQYVANSPSLWWNGGEAFGFANRSERWAEPKSLFVSVGADEGNDAPWRMVDNVRRLVAELRQATSDKLRLTAHVFEGESHTSVIPAALSRGLRAVLTGR